jgi:cytochrome c5
MTLIKRIASIAPLALAAACGSPSQAPAGPDAIARAQAAAPSDTRLAGLYAQSCKTCHAVADSGAPLALDRSSWDPRWAKGQDALLQSVVAGLNGMPAGGQCFSCTPEDYRALTAFMAGRD